MYSIAPDIGNSERRMRSGRHLLLQYHGCDREVLDDIEEIRAALIEAVSAPRGTPVKDIVHQLQPARRNRRGRQRRVAFGDPHLARAGFAAVNLFTCGNSLDPWRAFDHLSRCSHATSDSVVGIRRGLIPGEL